jgi:hypothetical protein
VKTLLERLDRLIRIMAAGTVTKEGSGVMFNQSATDFVRRFRSAQTRLVLARSQVGSFYEGAAESRGNPLHVAGTMPGFALKQFARDVVRAVMDRTAPVQSVQKRAQCRVERRHPPSMV